MWLLIAANLTRNPTRTGLSAASLIVAFLLLMLLQSIAARFSTDAADTDTVLLVVPEHRSGYQLPISHIEKIRRIGGVRAVSPLQIFYGYFQDLKNSFQASGVYPDVFMLAYEGLTLDPESLSQFKKIRTGALVTQSLAESFGWRVGDRVPVHSRAHPQRDGSWVWTFEIVAILEPQNGRGGSRAMIFHYDYFKEASGSTDDEARVGLMYAVVDDPENAAAIAREIDAALAITPEPTRTITQDYANRMWARQLGDIGRITTIILTAVFFSVLIVAGNGAIQAMRERSSEYATMKTLGFTNSFITRLMFSENVILCLACSALAIIGAYGLEPVFNDNLGEFVGSFEMTVHSSLLTAGTALGTACLISLMPAFDLWRLDIVRALGRD